MEHFDKFMQAPDPVVKVQAMSKLEAAGTGQLEELPVIVVAGGIWVETPFLQHDTRLAGLEPVMAVVG